MGWRWRDSRRRCPGAECFASPASLGRPLCSVVGLGTPSDAPQNPAGTQPSRSGLGDLGQVVKGWIRLPLAWHGDRRGPAGAPCPAAAGGGRPGMQMSSGAAASGSDKSSGRGVAQKPLPPGSRPCAPARHQSAPSPRGPRAPGKDARRVGGPRRRGERSRVATGGPARAARVALVPASPRPRGAVQGRAFSVGTGEPASLLRPPRGRAGGISPGSAQGQFVPRPSAVKCERCCVRRAQCWEGLRLSWRG